MFLALLRWGFNPRNFVEINVRRDIERQGLDFWPGCE
jgi:hypothetical protein